MEIGRGQGGGRGGRELREEGRVEDVRERLVGWSERYRRCVDSVGNC